MLASSAYRMTRPPLVAGGVAMLWGYVRSMLQGKERYSDEEFRAFLRRYQMQCLLTGKVSATRRLNQRQASRWTAPERRPAPPAAAEAMAS
jgi:poly-beta-1,6-N-acetyl-D-glucosamine synthase